MGKRMGRSLKVPTEEKIAIVDRYYITYSDGYSAQFGGHGIYQQLSDFAKSLNYNLEAYDFSRNNSVREHINQLMCQSVQETNENAGIPTYEPLDIVALMMTGRENIEKTVREREAYFADLHCRAAKAIENYVSVSKLCTRYQSEVKTLKEQNRELRETMDSLAVELRTSMKDVGYLKRIIRKNVEPDLAQQFLEGLSSREIVVQKVAPSVLSNISKLTADDQKTRLDTQVEIDMLDINNLLK